MIEFSAFLSRKGFTLDAEFQSGSRALALFGPSGAGKSTVLNLLAGLARAERSRIVVNDQVFSADSPRVFLPPQARRVGLVFQDSLLFPHLSVQGNLVYGRRGAGATRVSFDEVVDLLGIAHLMARKPAALSGGEKQRVAIGRALLSEPDLLLLDEPLASLDQARQAEIMPYLIALRDSLKMPMVIVTHALEEVVRLAEDVVCLDQGVVTAVSPVTDFVFQRRSDEPGFSDVAVLEALVEHFDEADEMTVLSHPAGRINLAGRLGEPGKPYRVLVRATDVALAVSRPRDVSHRTVLRARITAMQGGEGPLVRVTLALEGRGRLMSLITRQAVRALAIDVGDQVFAMTKAAAIDDRAFAAAGQFR